VDRIIAIIITYNPDIIRLQRNIDSIIYQVETVLLIDNGSNNVLDLKKLIHLLNCKIIINSQNLGIASALSQGLEYAKNNNFKYLLTLDQDSISTDGMVKELLKGFNMNKNVAIVGPEINDLNKDEVIIPKDELIYVN